MSFEKVYLPPTDKSIVRRKGYCLNTKCYYKSEIGLCNLKQTCYISVEYHYEFSPIQILLEEIKDDR